MFFELEDDFTWGGLWHEIRHGEWSIGWDRRTPLPGGWLGGACYIWYDGPQYALRLWRVYICNWQPPKPGQNHE